MGHQVIYINLQVSYCPEKSPQLNQHFIFMKVFFTAVIAFLFLSCQKDISKSESTSKSLTVSNDALVPLPCHTTSFVTDYPPTPIGQVPPFRFTKTLYSDTRVKTINMLHRAYPNYSTYKKQAYETIGTFTYSTNAAKFVGTVQTFEYYKTATNTAGKRSIAKKNVTINFTFNSSGYCQTVTNSDGSDAEYTYEFTNPNQTGPLRLSNLFTHESQTGNHHVLYFKHDRYGNLTQYNSPYGVKSIINIYYDYLNDGRKTAYIPTQYGVSFEHNLVEVMQWLPQSNNPRKSISIRFPKTPGIDIFDGTTASTTVLQGQTYLNSKYDTKKNLISYTYADKVLQKIGWFCK